MQSHDILGHMVKCYHSVLDLLNKNEDIKRYIEIKRFIIRIQPLRLTLINDYIFSLHL